MFKYGARGAFRPMENLPEEDDRVTEEIPEVVRRMVLSQGLNFVNSLVVLEGALKHLGANANLETMDVIDNVVDILKAFQMRHLKGWLAGDIEE